MQGSKTRNLDDSGTDQNKANLVSRRTLITGSIVGATTGLVGLGFTSASREAAAVTNVLTISDVSKTLKHDETVSEIIITVLGEAEYTADVIPDSYTATLYLEGEEVASVSDTLTSKSDLVEYQLQGDLLNTSLTSSDFAPAQGEPVDKQIHIEALFELFYGDSILGDSSVSAEPVINLDKETLTSSITQASQGSISIQTTTE